MEKWKYDYLVEQLHRTAYKRHECFVLGALFHDTQLAELKPITQYHVRLGDSYALLDLYYPQLNVAVEVDEPYHEDTSEQDLLRQRQVEQQSSCQFFRIRIGAESPAPQIEALKAKLLDMVRVAKEQHTWSLWTEPQRLDIQSAKAEFRATLFIKIRGEIPPDELLARQTGYWSIDEGKADKIKRVVVVHDDTVSAVFDEPEWWEITVKTKKRTLKKTWIQWSASYK